MMENINIVINKSTRMVNLSKKVIGNDGENLQENLVFSFDDEFVDGTARLELKKQGQTKSYIMLEKVEETYQLPVKSIITKSGRLDMQLVITEGTDDEEIPVFKSNSFYVVVNSSINAEIEEDDEYPQWIDIANTKLNTLDEVITEASNLNIELTKENTVATITLTDKEGNTKEVEIYDGEPGADGRNGINGITPTIGDNGNWYLGETDTGKPSKGERGEKGDAGERGPAGPQGERGPKGDTGSTGPAGPKGDTGSTGSAGIDGQDGADGFSPIANVSKTNNITTITITDSNGTTTANLIDGVNGSDGRDGYVQYTAGDNITIENNVISASVPQIDLSQYTKFYPMSSATSTSAPFIFSGKKLGIYTFYDNFNQNFYYKAEAASTRKQEYMRPAYINIYKEYDDAANSENFASFLATTDTNIIVGYFIAQKVEGQTNNVSIHISYSCDILSQNSQTIYGAKTFNSIPKLNSYSAPTTDVQLTAKKYVDDQVSLKTIQYSTMPTANSDNLGKIVQFTGTTDTYTNGYFYTCATDGTNYSWEQLNVQPGSSGGSVEVGSAYQSAVEPFVFSGKKKGIYYNPALNSDTFYFKKNNSDSLRSYTRGRVIFVILTKDYDESASDDIFGSVYTMDTYITTTVNGAFCCRTIRNSNNVIAIDNSGTNMPGAFVTTYNQSFDGVKTFQQVPQLSSYTAPTADAQLVAKKYVDDKISTAIGNINTILATLTTPSE